MTYQDRAIQGMKTPGVGQQGDVVLFGLAETDARIQGDAPGSIAGGPKVRRAVRGEIAALRPQRLHTTEHFAWFADCLACALHKRRIRWKRPA